MLFFQTPRKKEDFRGKPPTTPRMGIAKRSNAKPGKRKNYIFKGPLTSFLTNKMSCFSIAAFPMDAALERRRQCWRSISATKPARLNQQEWRAYVIPYCQRWRGELKLWRTAPSIFYYFYYFLSIIGKIGKIKMKSR